MTKKEMLERNRVEPVIVNLRSIEAIIKTAEEFNKADAITYLTMAAVYDTLPKRDEIDYEEFFIETLNWTKERLFEVLKFLCDIEVVQQYFDEDDVMHIQDDPLWF